MASPEEDTFFLKIFRAQGLTTGFTITFERDNIDLSQKEENVEEKPIATPDVDLFANVINDFGRSMAMYLRFVPLALSFGSILTPSSIHGKIVPFAKKTRNKER